MTHAFHDVPKAGGTPAHRLARRKADALPSFSLVVPVFNGAATLPSTLDQLATLLEPGVGCPEIILVDDHSEPGVEELLRRFSHRRPGVVLLRNDRNRGKGYSVARGMLRARGRYLLFTDADLAYPLEEIDRILALLEAGVDVAIASRTHPNSRRVSNGRGESYLAMRKLMSRTFNGLVRRTLLPGLSDTQAGLKGFSRRASDLIFERAEINGFAFDVEALFIARKHGLVVRETAVTFRAHEDPSTLRLSRDTLAMLRDVAKVRLNDWWGSYE